MWWCFLLVPRTLFPGRSCQDEQPCKHVAACRPETGGCDCNKISCPATRQLRPSVSEEMGARRTFWQAPNHPERGPTSCASVCGMGAAVGVIVHCDNEAAVNSGYSQDQQIMHLLRCLFFIKAHFQLELRVVHIPGADNVVADAISLYAFSHRSLHHPLQSLRLCWKC